MKYLPFIVRNLFRKKTRTILTIGSIAVALFLFGLLAAIEAALNAGVDVAGVGRLIVRNKISLIMPFLSASWMNCSVGTRMPSSLLQRARASNPMILPAWMETSG